MSGFIEGVDRDQVTLFPDRLEDWIDEDHLVRVVDLFVDQLDLAGLGFTRAAHARTGRPGYHPAILLKLFIYGYLNRIPSSRRLEREAGRNVEVMWLLGRLVPDHKTIADFRRDNGGAIRKTCAQFVELCRRIGTLKGDCVAIDGSKFKAVNNRDKNFTKGKIASRLAHLEVDVERYLTEMVRIDRQETGEARLEKVTHLAHRYGRLKQEIEKLKAMDKALADAPDGQTSLTDPDARAMATSAHNSGLVGYNAQCAVDTETHIIVTHDITNKGFDRDQLSPMAMAAKEALGRDTLHALADKGYYSGVEIAACDKAGITVTMPRPETSGNRSKGMYVKADFKYDAARDVYICPTGDELTYRYTREEDGLQVARYWTNECQTYPVKSRCTTGTDMMERPHETQVSERSRYIYGEVALEPKLQFEYCPPEGLHFENLAMSDFDKGAYIQFVELIEGQSELDWQYASNHKVLGWSNNVQAPMEEECAMVTSGIYCGGPEGYNSPEAKKIMSEPNEWVQLLEIGTDNEADMMWGDMGTLFLWIKQSDLEHRNFENTWLILQSN